MICPYVFAQHTNEADSASVFIEEGTEKTWRTPFLPLVGRWQVADKEAYEEWVYDEIVDQFRGNVYKLSDGNKVFLESLIIYRDGGQIVYAATVPDQNEGNTIKFTFHEDGTKLQFHNLEHDFPKLIEYRIESNDRIMVHVSGEAGTGFSQTLSRVSE
jgi:hypothetical protein